MAKSDKEFYWRMQGMIYALKIVKESGADALEKEIRMRGLTAAPIGCPKKDVDKLYSTFSRNIYMNMLSAMCYTLHDTFGFGGKRLKKLREEFTKNTDAIQDLDYMGQHYVRLQDYAIELNERYDLGIDVELIASCEENYDETDKRTRMCRIDRVLEVLKAEGYYAAVAFLEDKLE